MRQHHGMSQLAARCTNLIRHDREAHPFAEPFAQCSIGFAESGVMGWGALHPRGVLSTYRVAEPTLQLWLVGDGGWRAVKRRSLVSQPWQVVESALVGALAVESTSVFTGPSSLLVSFTFRNTGLTPCPLNPVWCGVVRPEAGLYMLPYFDGAPRAGRRHTCHAAGTSVVAALTASDTASVLPDVGWRLAALAGRVEAHEHPTAPWASNGGPRLDPAPLWYGLHAPASELAPGAEATWLFRLDLVVGTADLPPLQTVDLAEALTEARARFDVALGTAPEDDLVLRARLGLLRDGLLGSGRFAGQQVSLCTADSSDFSCVFFWDSLFSSVAIAPWNPAHARDAVRAVFTDQDPRDGSSGERHWDHGVPQRMLFQSPQMPVASWAVWEQVRHHTDRSFLREVWPQLQANHRFWQEFSDTDRDGLAEIRWSGQYSDNSPLWDVVGMGHNPGNGCGWLPPLASVAVNSFLYRDAGHLAQLADLLELPSEARTWKERQGSIAKALHTVCYLPAERRYWDFNHHTRSHRRVRTFWMFWPLWAGLPVPAETANDLIDGVLLDPRQFFGAVPFPSVAYDDPTHDPEGYWRGRSWPHVATWLCETLWRYDRRDAADEAVRRLLAWFSASDGLRENMCSDPAHPKPGGFPDYNWGCAAVDLLASGRWRELRP